ncbi:MAG: hypothetical protein P1V13_20580 [Rhizobiaceae bacterium]|nr:hypothetical protein [Rhizobiaceae bacterium]
MKISFGQAGPKSMADFAELCTLGYTNSPTVGSGTEPRLGYTSWEAIRIGREHFHDNPVVLLLDE